MNAELRIDTHQQMHVIRHHLHLFNESLVFLTHLMNDLLEANIHCVDQHFPAIFRTPDHVIMAVRGHMVIGSQLSFHTNSI
jgi:hypothetical protein